MLMLPLTNRKNQRRWVAAMFYTLITIKKLITRFCGYMTSAVSLCGCLRLRLLCFKSSPLSRHVTPGSYFNCTEKLITQNVANL